jgi:hypothetical protein
MNWSRVAAAFLLAFAPVVVVAKSGGDIDQRKYVADIKQLTNKSFRGRGSGSPELEKAAKFLAKEFRKAGLRPLTASTFLQPFSLSVKATQGAHNELSYTLAGERTDVKPVDGFSPYSFSSSGSVQGPVVFAGYGITAPEYGYDDYAGIDVRGKIVLLLKHEPQEFEGASVFEGRVYTEHSQLFSKALNARAHGATAILYVNDTANHGSDTMEKFVSLPGPADAGIPFVQISSAHVEVWFQATNRAFRETIESIDRSVKPNSFPLASDLRVSLRSDVDHTARDIHNVIGFIPGATDEYVIIGAHYDHLGVGEQYSLAPEKAGTVHPGADDNASGVAGLLALARYFGSRESNPKPPRGIVFIAFAGEELGLLGSVHYTNHPPLPLSRAQLMINMDMIGRIRENKVMVGGAAPGTPMRGLLDALGPKYKLDLDLSDTSVYGSSDHTSFKSKRVPTLFFFSGLHADYHRPTDTWEKIDAAASVRLLRLIADLTTVVATPKSRPQFAVSQHSQPAQYR